MEFKISKKSKDEELNKFNSISMRKELDARLDKAWQSSWINQTIVKSHMNEHEAIKNFIESMLENVLVEHDKKLVVVFAHQELIDFFSISMNALLKCNNGLYECNFMNYTYDIVLVKPTFCSMTLSRILDTIKNRNSVLLAISMKDEGVEYKAGYEILKKAIVSSNQKQANDESIYGILSYTSTYIANDMKQAGYTHIIDTIDTENIFNSKLATFLYTVIGKDVRAYFTGIYDMVTTTRWNKDLDEPILNYLLNRTKLSQIRAYQEEVHFIAQYFSKISHIPYDAKEDMESDESFNIIIYSLEEKCDIMTPFFEGCSEEGSLNLLLQKRVYDFNDENTGQIISIDKLDEYRLGQVLCYLNIFTDAIRV